MHQSYYHVKVIDVKFFCFFFVWCSFQILLLELKISSCLPVVVFVVALYQALLREAAKEVDTIVHQMGLRVDIPVRIFFSGQYTITVMCTFVVQMFPTLVGDGTDVKKGMADMLVGLYSIHDSFHSLFE